MLDTSRQVIAKTKALYSKDFLCLDAATSCAYSCWRLEHIDRLNLVEEIESLGKQQRQEMRNRLSILLAHLLKWEYQSQKRSRSWLATIRVQRRDLLRLLEESPSLKPY